MRTTSDLPIRIEDDSWSYRGESTSGYTHRLHSYPAMMIPQVARRLIGKYAFDGATVLDPFCGSGSVLVEANVAGCHAWGFDINPLAVLIARVKSTPSDPESLRTVLDGLLRRVEQIRDPQAPSFFNLDFWFKPEVVLSLSRLHAAVMEIEDERSREFLSVVLSEVVRLSSNSRNREFKLYRYSPSQMAAHNPDSIEMFRVRSLRNIEGMSTFYDAARPDRFVRPSIHSTMEEVSPIGGAKPVGASFFGRTPLRSCTNTVDNSVYGAGPLPDTVDLVLTSPPYGDSRTTVAYGQFSRLSLQFLGHLCGYDFSAANEKPQELDRRMLGGTPNTVQQLALASATLERAVEQIAAKDGPRARDVIAFYADFSVCLRNLVPLVKPGGILCFVVGNRRVKGVQLDTDYIIAEMGSHLGLIAEGVTVRSIPTKRMPLRNSPSNRPGETEDTMHQEYILVLRKPGQGRYVV